MLEAPEKMYAPAPVAATTPRAPRRAAKGPSLRRDTSEDFARRESRSEPDDLYDRPRGMRFKGVRFRLNGGVPRSMAGRIFAGAVVLGGLAGFTAILWEARALLLENPALVIRSSSSVQIMGNQHITRPQLLSIFGGDVDRNLLTVSLDERRAQLERLPWVEHATVMRLFPNKIRIALVERTPVAFVRQGSHIGLVDKSGVLLDMAEDSPADAHYSFPVLTGISAEDPASVRAARMQLYQRFMNDLDAGPDKVSQLLSEVDISSPEDVKALIPSDGTDILVHFGDDDFLARYQKFKERLPEWKSQYPKLASVDMRYDRQVVLEMAPGSAAPAKDAEAAPAAKPVKPASPAGKKTPAKAPAKPAPKPVAKPAHAAAIKPAPHPVTAHSETAFDVHPKPAKPHTPQADPQ